MIVGGVCAPVRSPILNNLSTKDTPLDRTTVPCRILAIGFNYSTHAAELDLFDRAIVRRLVQAR